MKSRVDVYLKKWVRRDARRWRRGREQEGNKIKGKQSVSVFFSGVLLFILR